jgi:hypothetical protein
MKEKIRVAAGLILLTALIIALVSYTKEHKGIPTGIHDIPNIDTPTKK